MEDILNKDGNEFSMKAHLINTLRNRDLIDKYVAYPTENGGFIGVPVGDERIKNIPAPEAKPDPPKKKKFRVRVYRANCDDENRDLVIKVTANNPKNRKVFHPGEDVELTEAQMNILKDSVTNNEIQIEANSGIYSSRNPEVAAKNMYPGMQVKRDHVTGLITVFRHIPNFIIEHLENA